MMPNWRKSHQKSQVLRIKVADLEKRQKSDIKKNIYIKKLAFLVQNHLCRIQIVDSQFCQFYTEGLYKTVDRILFQCIGSIHHRDLILRAEIFLQPFDIRDILASSSITNTSAIQAIDVFLISLELQMYQCTLDIPNCIRYYYIKRK